MGDKCDSYILPCPAIRCLYNGAKRLSFVRSVRSCCADRMMFPDAPPCPNSVIEKKTWADAQSPPAKSPLPP